MNEPTQDQKAGGASIRVRTATPEDCDGMGLAMSRCLFKAYAGIIPDEVFDPEFLEPSKLATEIRHEMDNVGDDRCMFVAEADGRVIGHTFIRPYPTDFDVVAGQVKSLYVDPDSWGRGAGTNLLDAATGFISSTGRYMAVLHVLKANIPARRFYEHRGWVYDCDLLPLEIGMHSRYRLQIIETTA